MARLKLTDLGTLAALVVVLAACTVGPDYVRPKVDVPLTYKETEGWKKAQPRDDIPRGPWWQIFGDSTLNDLEEQVNISNQNLAAAEARYRQALAAVKAARADFFPILTGGTSVSRSRGSENAGSGGSRTGSDSTSGTTSTSSGSATTSSHSLSASFSWELDLWGKVRRNVESNEASAKASAADLEGLRLTAHAQLAQSYFQLRTLDSQKQVLERTVDADQKFLQLTKNRYEAGVASRSDVLQAETQLKSVQVQMVELGVQRSQLEHSIAILIGKAPAELTIPATPLETSLPGVPLEVPSQLLERRPDIASAERNAASANAQIGVAEAAYFPTISLSALGGFQASDAAKWLVWPSRFWTLGPAALQQTIFDGGLRSAQTEKARQTYEEKAATYRQTVLAGFQQVEDFLAAVSILEQEAGVQAEALDVARQSLDVTINRYKAGIASALDVIVTQNAALSAEQNSVSILGRRFTACVQLIQALGGDWRASEVSHPSLNAAKD